MLSCQYSSFCDNCCNRNLPQPSMWAQMCLALQVSFWEYTWASSVGVLPGMAFFIYLGSLAHNLLDIGSTQPALNSPAAVMTIALSGVMITFVAALTGAAAADDVHAMCHCCPQYACVLCHAHNMMRWADRWVGVRRHVCQEGGCNTASTATIAAAIRQRCAAATWRATD